MSTDDMCGFFQEGGIMCGGVLSGYRCADPMAGLNYCMT